MAGVIENPVEHEVRALGIGMPREAIERVDPFGGFGGIGIAGAGRSVGLGLGHGRLLCAQDSRLREVDVAKDAKIREIFGAILFKI